MFFFCPGGLGGWTPCGTASAGGARRRKSFEAVFCFLEGHESALQISPAAFGSRAVVGWGVAGGESGWMFVSLGVLLRCNYTDSLHSQ